MLLGAEWGQPVALIGLGALLYTSTNSLGWAFSRRERVAYAPPMIVGAVGGLISIVLLMIVTT